MTISNEARLAAEEPALHAFVSKRAGALLRYEESEDLVQGILMRAFDRVVGSTFESDAELRAWLFTLGTHYMADRRSHWQALKRGGGKIARLTVSGASGDGIPLPALDESGPRTRAARRELLVLTTKALSVLPERDRHLVRWRAEGMPLEEQAERLGVSYASVQRAGLRAYERFRKVFELANRPRKKGL